MPPEIIGLAVKLACVLAASILLYLGVRRLFRVPAESAVAKDDLAERETQLRQQEEWAQRQALPPPTSKDDVLRARRERRNRALRGRP